MKKETRNILLLSLFSILLISFVAGVVSAAPNDPFSNSISAFFGHWADGTGLMNYEAKIMLALLIFTVFIIIASSLNLKWVYSLPLAIVLTFMTTAYITPDAITGIFQSYAPTAMTIATIIPLAAFFALTYIAAEKAKRMLLGIQWFAWLVFFIYAASKPVLGLFFNWFGNNWFGITWQIADIPTWGTTQAAYFWLATSIQILISLIMLIGNRWFVRKVGNVAADARDEAANRRLQDYRRGTDTAVNQGRIAAGEAPEEVRSRN